MPLIIDHLKRRKKILEAGIEAINDNTFTLANVSNKIGITRTGMYKYYDNKHELQMDIDKNLHDIKNKAEVAKYMLHTEEIEPSKYEKIYDILMEVVE